jgi:hypothetical protein
MSFDILFLVDPLLLGRPPLHRRARPILSVMPSKRAKTGPLAGATEHGYRKAIKVGRTGFPR